MQLRFPLPLLVALTAPLIAHATTYYVSPSGNDAAVGTSTSSPWRTIAKVNGINFAAGDSILFQGGALFSGSLSFNSSDTGTDSARITVGSYGTGKATLDSGNGRGVYLQNTAGFTFSNLIVKGSGIGANTSNGIEVSNTSGVRTGVRIQNCEVQGYGSPAGGATLSNGYGIFIWAGAGAGIAKIEVLDTVVHHCENTGMFAWAATLYQISNVTIRKSIFRDNPGRSGLTNHSGNGLLLGSVEGALVEYCSAYNNGALNTAGSGPVGIWTYDSNNVTIQYCESYSNKTTSGADGGGFDLDGGVTNSIIQYCYSHDNHGAGYLLACYSGANPMSNNVIRYNISENDGRRGSYGGISLWGAGSGDRIENTLIYGNTLYCGTETPILGGTPSALRLMGGEFSGVKIWNNLFVMKGTTNYIVNADTAVATTAAQLQGNNYWATDSFRLKWGATIQTTFAGWTASATTQERVGSAIAGLNANPLLNAAGTGGTIGDPTLLASNLTAYRLQSSSPMINTGLNLQVQFGVNPGAMDFYGSALPQGGALDIGAHESIGGGTPGGSISAFSSQQAGNEAVKAIDGIDNDDNNRWSGSTASYPQWIEVDLGSNKPVNGTKLYTMAGRAYQFRVEAKPDGGTYQTVVDRTASTQAGPIVDSFPFITARYVKLTVTGAYNYTGGWVSIREFKVLVSSALLPEADSYVRDGTYATNSFGTATSVVVKKDALSYTRHAYLRFGLSSLPGAAAQAWLRLPVTNAGDVGAVTYEIRLVTDDTWTETGLNWNNKPAGSTLLATFLGKTSGYIDVNLTGQVNTERIGNGKLSILIQSTTSGSTYGIDFGARENSDPSLRSNLLIQY